MIVAVELDSSHGARCSLPNPRPRERSWAFPSPHPPLSFPTGRTTTPDTANYCSTMICCSLQACGFRLTLRFIDSASTKRADLPPGAYLSLDLRTRYVSWNNPGRAGRSGHVAYLYLDCISWSLVPFRVCAASFTAVEMARRLEAFWCVH